jgi:redox-sensitive bicupin YhaK (pirin superfamily)
MSAGKGIVHSEKNKNLDKPVKFLQIWIIPNQQNVSPRYDQITLHPEDRKNTLQEIVSPEKKPNSLWIYQDAWFYLSKLDANNELKHKLHNSKNGLYCFVISGSIQLDNQKLDPRDGLGIKDADEIHIHAESDSEFLLMEVPL